MCLLPMQLFSVHAAPSFQDYQRPVQAEQSLYTIAWKAVTNNAQPHLWHVHNWPLSMLPGNVPYVVRDHTSM